MAENKTILHELYVFSEWKPEPEYLQKSDNILPENISSLWRWLKFFGPKKSLIDSVTAHKEKQQKWHMALGDEGKVIAVLTDNILEIRTKRSEYATIAARTTVSRDGYSQWRKLVWSPDCSFIVVAYGNGIVSFFDLTGSNLFNIPADCSKPGGLECTDNTHAVSDIIFRPLRVKDTKWNWEVLVVTYDGKLRGYLVSQTDGFKLHHTFRFPGGVAAASYCEPHGTLYIAGVPKAPYKDPSSPVSAGITAWRVINDEPFYKLSVVSGELESQLANERFHLYMPFVHSKNMNFIVRMVPSLGHGRLVCAHCNGDVSVWRLPALQAERRFRLAEQPQHALQSPLRPPRSARDHALHYPADVNWWTDEEIIVSRYSGAVTVCGIKDMVNILGKKPEFFQGTPKVTWAHNGAFMVLECESNVLPGRKSRSDESMEVVKAEAEMNDSMLEVAKELVKSVLYAITDIETFQPKPKKITVVSRIYRLLGVKSTTPTELFSRKIESGNYTEALALAETFGLDSDLVYQQQWRKNPVSTEAIQNYLSKVSKKIWAVHQCADRLPESLPAAKELLQFGLELTNQTILDEINKDLPEDQWKDSDSVTLEDLNAYTSELLRCRHVMLFYKERLRLYEAILRSERSTYVKDEYHRLRSNSIVHSAMEIAEEGRIDAMTCLWPYIKSLPLQLAVVDRLPETLFPQSYQILLPSKEPMKFFEQKSQLQIVPIEQEDDWCKKEIFRSIWSSNWSEDTTPENETAGSVDVDLTAWYDKRAREIEERSGLVSHAFTLLIIGKLGAAVDGLDRLLFHVYTLDTLLYSLNVEGVTLSQLEKMTNLQISQLLMKVSTPETFVADLKEYLVPFLKRYEVLTNQLGTCISGIIEFMESMSVDDLSHILLVLKCPKEYNVDVRTRLELVERCLFAHTGTDQLDMACDLLGTLLKETDGSISNSELLRRCEVLEQLVAGSERLACRGVRVPPCALRDLNQDADYAQKLLAMVARSLVKQDGPPPTQQDWENLLKDMLELRTKLFDCISVEQCYEIYVSALLASGLAPSILLAAEVLTTSPTAYAAPDARYRIDYRRSVELVSNAAREYFNSASSLTDPALDLAKCCLFLIESGNKEIELEMDLISALPLLASFSLTKLPIQVRLCEDKMQLIEECLTVDPNAYLACHKLLNLAKLLKIAGDDEQTREGDVLVVVGERALAAGAAGGGAAGAVGRRLAALRHPAAASLLARLAAHAHAHVSTADRKTFLAAALTFAPSDKLEEMLHARLKLELESLQQMGSALRDNSQLETRWASTEEEFSDAITTPVIEKKDLIAPTPSEEKPILKYLLDSIQNKFSVSNVKSTSPDISERTVHCEEFYRALYPEYGACNTHYAYEGFAAPAHLAGPPSAAHSALNLFFIQDCLQYGESDALEEEVVEQCAEEIMYSDTPLSVACMLAACVPLPLNNSAVAVSATLYANLIKCNEAELGDDVYLINPRKMACITLKENNIPKNHISVIKQCLDKLNGMSEVMRIRELGLTVNGLLFNADSDYRQEVIYRLARLGGIEQAKLACSLASKYGLDSVDVWLQYAAETQARVDVDTLPTTAYNAEAVSRIRDTLWPAIHGNQHSALIDFFSILKNIDDKTQMSGLTVVEHIKLLKKAKAASSELDYKLLLDQPSSEAFTSHILAIIKPENVGLLTKFLRTLPPAFKIHISINSLYTMWLTKYFFSEGIMGGSNKKWMQAWRQCASFFTKLSKEELLKLVAATCFSAEALHRVPSGTRNLMIMQAVDYCQQEQENDFKFNKHEQSWAEVGQELTRWARFLENYHSSSVQGIIDNSDVSQDSFWPDLQMSHGDVERALDALAQIAVRGGLRPAALSSLLQCLHLALTTEQIFDHVLQTHVHNLEDIQTLVMRLTQFHKEGVKFSEVFLDRVLEAAVERGMPPHRQLGLLSLSARSRVQDGDDLLKMAHSTVDLFKTEWPDAEYAQHLTEESLLTADKRREVFTEFLGLCDTWQRKKAIVDVLSCWPPEPGDGRSLHCEYIQGLLAEDKDPKDSLVLIQLLLRRPLLPEEDLKWLVEIVNDHSLINTVWVLLLNKCSCSEELLYNLLKKYKDTVLNNYIEEELLKEMLDQGLFIKFVSSPFYTPMLNYIMNVEASSEEPTSVYTIKWATNELIKANFLAEAGHLKMLAVGIPAELRGFSEAVLLSKSMIEINKQEANASQ